ncbi:MAG TPA: energy transducer TonB [Bryobacteraceae bacterium]|nr:energy transducer TonB [Bryobacteraceae bacterium]
MFEQSLLDDKSKTNKPWTIVVSFIIQCSLIGIAVLIPLIYYDALPKGQLTSFLTAPPPPPPPPPPPAMAPPKVIRVIPRQFDAGKLMAPKVIPKNIAMIKEDELPPPSSGVVGGVYGGVPGGAAGGVLGGIISSAASAAPPPPPPPPPAAPKVTRVRVGGNVQAAAKVRGQNPAYPPLAKQARIQGHVVFTAIIGRDGTIQNLQLVSGHPLLVPAAQAAVSQWVYRPTLLNGEPVEVITQIDVNFTLSQ